MGLVVGAYPDWWVGMSTGWQGWHKLGWRVGMYLGENAWYVLWLIGLLDRLSGLYIPQVGGLVRTLVGVMVHTLVGRVSALRVAEFGHDLLVVGQLHVLLLRRLVPEVSKVSERWRTYDHQKDD